MEIGKLSFRAFIQISFKTQRRYMSEKNMDLDQMKIISKKIFSAGVNSVKPDNLMMDSLKIGDGNILKINDTQFSLPQKIHLVGFGKAVAGMTTAIEELLEDKITEGIISVPVGTTRMMKSGNQINLLPKENGKIQVLEGAKNNLPDQDSFTATKEIVKMISNLDSENLLLVLISGGGSALLTYPKPPITLAEKIRLIQQLSNKGASIQELNCIRKRISLVKGGGLAKLAHPCKVISLILSDIIGNPLDLIASSPTVENKDDKDQAIQILLKYLQVEEVPLSIMNCLTQSQDHDMKEKISFHHVFNYLIGTNLKALEAADSCAKDLNYITYILSSTLEGEAATIGKCYAKLVKAILNMERNEPPTFEDINCLSTEFGKPAEIIKEVITSAVEAVMSGRMFCMLSGGETTVTVKGKGTGGRNQEMSLSFCIESDRLEIEDNFDVLFMSAGSDGIDGPTDAAGAFAYPNLARQARKYNLDPLFYLKNNDSYSFFNAFKEGGDHFILGHTGTNVMDLQILLIQPKL